MKISKKKSKSLSAEKRKIQKLKDKFKRRSGETWSQHKIRTVRLASDLTEDDWYRLDGATQQEMNNLISLLNEWGENENQN